MIRWELSPAPGERATKAPPTEHRGRIPRRQRCAAQARPCWRAAQRSVPSPFVVPLCAAPRESVRGPRHALVRSRACSRRDPRPGDMPRALRNPSQIADRSQEARMQTHQLASSWQAQRLSGSGGFRVERQRSASSAGYKCSPSDRCSGDRFRGGRRRRCQGSGRSSPPLPR